MHLWYCKLCVCRSAEVAKQKTPTSSMIYLFNSLHSNTSTVLISTIFCARVHFTSLVMDVLSETILLEGRATSFITCRFSMCFFSNLPRTATVNRAEPIMLQNLPIILLGISPSNHLLFSHLISIILKLFS